MNFLKSMTKLNLKSGAGYFLLGALAMLSLVLLTGAVDTAQTTLGNSRYQLATWGTQFGADSGGFGAFLTDTASGETKMVYARIYGDPEKGKAVVDELGKKFVAIKE